MKKPMFGKIKAILCVLLSLCLVLPFAACEEKTDGPSGEELKMSAPTGTVDVGARLLLSVTGASGPVSWESDDESVATVNPLSSKIDTSARVTGVKVGTAVIIATSGDSSVTCIVTVADAETISITKDGSPAPTNIKLDGQNDTVQLSATSSKGHNIAWESSDPLLATVSTTGLVTAVAKGGTVTVTAKCAESDNTGSAKASVIVTIGSGIATSYDIPFAADPTTDPGPGMWSQWSEFQNVTSATYDDGVVSISFSNNGARWVNTQLRYLPTESEGLVPGNLYEVTFDATLSFPDGFEAAGGRVTVNGTTVYLSEGTGHYSVYYIQGPAYDGDSPMSFNMMMGYQNGTPAGAWDLTDATVVLKNITWTERQPTPLAAPTFSITDNVITFSDANPEGSVLKHVLVLYKGNKRVGEVTVTNGAQLDVSKILVNGELTGKLKAVAASPRYTDSPEATSDNCTVTVDNPHVEYNLQYNDGTPAAGTWAYWTENWVEFTGVYNDGIVTATFSNNAGNWYDTQLKYKSLHSVGEKYSIKLHINVDGAVTPPGKITISGKVYNLSEGDNTIDLEITEGDGDSIVIVFGVYGGNNAQDIKAATVTISMEEL